jgi:hypothetical protein
MRSKFQVGGLIIVALLVLVIRLAGGGADPSDRQMAGSNGAGEIDQEEVARRNQLSELLRDSSPPRRKQAKQPAAQADDILEGLVDGDVEMEPKGARRAPSDSGNSFEDIRRSLGIE